VALLVADASVADLLELVHGQDAGLVGRGAAQRHQRRLQPAHRVAARLAHRDPTPVCAQPGEHAGAQERGLARARGADQGEEAGPVGGRRRAEHARNQVVGHLLTPEEPLGVLDVEAEQSPEGRDVGVLPSGCGAQPDQRLAPRGRLVLADAQGREKRREGVLLAQRREVSATEVAAEGRARDAGPTAHLTHREAAAVAQLGQGGGEVLTRAQRRRVRAALAKIRSLPRGRHARRVEATAD
jgi:hypothetical protein